MIWPSTIRTSCRLGAGKSDQAWVSGPGSLAGCGRGGGQRNGESGAWWPSERLAEQFVAT
jgi:hypothetical protein